MIFLTSFAGRDDAGTVFRRAVQFNAGNFSLIKPGAYFYRYPHQLGMLSFESLILYLIPIPVISVFYVLNLVMVIGMNYATWKITDELFKKSHISRLAVIMSFVFYLWSSTLCSLTGSCMACSSPVLLFYFSYAT
ncbi:hypothetical protein [Streptococcus vestibularis]|uniref:hypothetical protein n=1 Tax=Streptococcus vestibularis TaxID=1343 RepID=UPI002330BC3A|nr:hypothetical protein [Streptococcus vestibularis]MDB6216498.1 hypothetical protein [Streptococcus vestibularis]